jgi:hypothetical protein
MNEKPRAALLIDADNLSPEGIERALADLEHKGYRVTVRRAYGSHETLVTLRDFLQGNSVRAVVNHGKGTTDAALIVDAMDLLHANGLPAVVAIGSGDGDFTPLVVRLREAGKMLICLAQRRKAASGLERAYDEVIYVDAPARTSRAAAPARDAAPARSQAPSAPEKPAPRKAAAARPPAPARPPEPPRQPAASKQAAAPRPPAAARLLAAPKPAAAPRQRAAAPVSDEDRIRRVLEDIPGFLDGEDIEMNVVVKRLRDEQLMSRSTSAPAFFRKHALNVQLRPEKQPNKIRWLG